MARHYSVLSWCRIWRRRRRTCSAE